MLSQESEQEQSIIRVLKNWAKDCSLKVISLIVNSKSIFKRVIWTVAIFLFAFILVDKLKQSIDKYMEYGTEASITVASTPDCEFPILKFKHISWLDYSLLLSEFYIIDKPESFLAEIHGLDPREALIESRKKFFATLMIQESKFNASLNKILIQKSIVRCRFGNYNCSIDDFDLIEDRLNEAAYLKFKNPSKGENQCNRYKYLYLIYLYRL
jgi:hypothetical protein